MKKKLLKVALPLIMMGSPALALSSVRSGSRNKIKKAVVQSDKTLDFTFENETSFDNPFGGFGGGQTTVADNATQPNVLAFLAEEGLLSASGEANTVVSGTERKEFLGITQCVPGAQYNGKGLASINSFLTSSSSYLDHHIRYTSSSSNFSTSTYAGDHLGNSSAAVLQFNNAKAACLAPTSVPTLSQWGQYLLVLLLGLFGTRRFSSLKSKAK